MIGVPAGSSVTASIPTRRHSSPPATLVLACAWTLVAALGILGAADARAQSFGLRPGRVPAPQASRSSLFQPASPITAQETPAEPVHVKAQTTVFIVGAAALAAVGAFQSKLAPSSCRWCDLHPDGTDALNGLDRSVRSGWMWQHPNTANTLSNVVAYGVVPAVALGADAWAAHAAGHGDNFKVDALVIGESVLAAAGAAQILKYATSRLRPYAHARALGEPTEVASSSSDNLSFSSGHAVFAFAMTVSAARVMALRRYNHAGWVWGLGLPSAAAVGYLRIAADRHYLTDVMASAGIGTAMGLIVPRLAFATPPAGSGSTRSVAIMPGVGGPLVAITCTW